jgi:HEAT repeat protein
VQHPAQLLVGVQRLAAAADLAQDGDELAVEPLVQRVGDDQRAQLGHELAVPAQLQIGLQAQLQRPHPHFLQVGDVRPEQPADGDVGQGGTAPQRQRLRERLGRPGVLTAGQLLLAPDPEPVELAGVDRGGLDDQTVARRVGLDELVRLAGAQPLPECLAQLVDVGLRGRHGTARRVLAPQLVDERVGLHHLVGSHEQ